MNASDTFARRPAPATLWQFQDDLAHALLDPGADASLPDELAALVRQPGFAVYRNTTMKGCIDALQANYPAVTRLVGEEWMRAAAAIFVRADPPTEATLLRYGNRIRTVPGHVRTRGRAAVSARCRAPRPVVDRGAHRP